MAPARRGRDRHPLALHHTRTTPRIPRAAAAAAGRDALASLRRSARGMVTEEVRQRGGPLRAIGPATMRWTSARPARAHRRLPRARSWLG